MRNVLMYACDFMNDLIAFIPYITCNPCPWVHNATRLHDMDIYD